MYIVSWVNSFTFTICFYGFSPWLEVPYKDAAEKTPGGNLTINGFLSEVCMLAVMLTLNWNQVFIVIMINYQLQHSLPWLIICYMC